MKLKSDFHIAGQLMEYHPEYSATAGTLLFRMYGIPARYVTGYVVQPEDFHQKDNKNFTCNVKDSSAHAWTEVYIGNGIWVPVEVTPSSSANEEENISINTHEDIVPETEVPPPSENIEMQKPNSPEDNHTSKNEKPSNTDTEKSEAGKTRDFDFLFVFRFLLVPCIILFLFTLRYQILSQKRIGHFAHNRTKGYFLLYQNLLRLWQTEFNISEKDLSAYDWKEKFKGHLPNNRKNDFEKLCNEAEEI